jgi:hypothetical protein
VDVDMVVCRRPHDRSQIQKKGVQEAPFGDFVYNQVSQSALHRHFTWNPPRGERRAYQRFGPIFSIRVMCEV